MVHDVTGTYSASCQDNYFRSGNPYLQTESASIIPGSKVEVSGFTGGQFDRNTAEATFSANYVFTLTGGTNLYDFGPLHGLGALALPCFTVVDNNPNPSSATFAALSGFQGLYSPGDSCSTSGGQPVLLNVPTAVQLTLTATHPPQNGLAPVFPFASAAFNGSFRFFVPGAGGYTPIDATYTFTLNDQLPANLPEPGSFAMIAAAAVVWLIVRRRLAANIWRRGIVLRE
jgi:hypothetical protein